MRILFCGGQSAGHLAPLLAVWEAVRADAPEAQALFVCSEKKSDASFLAHADVPYRQITTPKISFLLPFTFMGACIAIWKILKAWKPDAIFSKGGAVSVPVCLVGWMQRIPIVLHESDAVSGRSNAFVGRFARAVCVGFPNQMQPHASTSAVYTGNPIRSFITQGSREEGQRITGFSLEKPVLLIMGGSQGARALNEAVAKVLDDLLLTFDVLHLTGEGKGDGAVDRAGYRTFAFAEEELAHLYAMTTVALSRAGAGAISELAAWQIPMVLVPLEGLAQNHQLVNAQVMEHLGAAVLLRQNEMSRKLVDTLRSLGLHPEARATLSKRLENVHSADAARRLAAILIKVISNPSVTRGKRGV